MRIIKMKLTNYENKKTDKKGALAMTKKLIVRKK